jgi:O-antigen/teichoic acid export membrane protein
MRGGALAAHALGRPGAVSAAGLAALRRRLGGNRFARRFAVLSGGLVLGQALILASSPILTRLFTPAEFGCYAAFAALSGLLGHVLSLRYELAVPLARSDRDAAGLVHLAALAVVASCAVTLPAVWLGGGWLAAATDMPALGALLWLLPVTVVLLSLGETLGYWSLYRGTVRPNATARLSQGAAQAGAQVALGLAGAGPAGLVCGYALGFAARLAHLLPGLGRADRRLLGTVRPAVLRRLARRHWRYPAYAAPSSLLEAGTQLLPTLLLAALYGPAVAGLFSLGQRLMGLPIRLLSQAARQIFLSEAGQRSRDGVHRLFVRSTLAFLVAGLAGMAPVILAGPELFALLFGEAWRGAGEMVQLLVPLYLTRFVGTPVSQTLNVLGRQHLHLLSSAIDAALMAGVFAAAWWLGLPPLTTVLLFSLGSTAAYLLYFAFAWRGARHGAAPGSGDVAAAARGLLAGEAAA